MPNDPLTDLGTKICVSPAGIITRVVYGLVLVATWFEYGWAALMALLICAAIFERCLIELESFPGAEKSQRRILVMLTAVVFLGILLGLTKTGWLAWLGFALAALVIFFVSCGYLLSVVLEAIRERDMQAFSSRLSASSNDA
jgi:hypothetical protein